MSLVKTLSAAIVLLALATPALVQGAEPCDLRERNAYVLDMQGKSARSGVHIQMPSLL